MILGVYGWQTKNERQHGKGDEIERHSRSDEIPIKTLNSIDCDYGITM